MRAFEAARGRDTLAMSRPVFDEVAEVLNRPRLARFVRPDLRDKLLALLSSGARWYEPAVAVAACRDPADDKNARETCRTRASPRRTAASPVE